MGLNIQQNDQVYGILEMQFLKCDNESLDHDRDIKYQGVWQGIVAHVQIWPEMWLTSLKLELQFKNLKAQQMISVSQRKNKKAFSILNAQSVTKDRIYTVKLLLATLNREELFPQMGTDAQ